MKDLREAYLAVYQNQLDEKIDPEERALRRAEIADKKASRMDPKVAAKYAGSEAKSAEREDKKSRGKHIHGMADSVELEDDLVEKKDDSYLETDMKKREKNNETAIGSMKKTKANADMVKAARKHFEETEIQERTLDTAETGEKERLVKGMKKSTAGFKERYGKRWKNVMYATATKQAKHNMDTSKSDRRYAVEGVSMDEATEAPEAPRKGRKPSEIAKREKLQSLINKIREKKEGQKED